MAKQINKQVFMLRLERQLDKNRAAVNETFKDLSPEILNWKQNRKEWSILQCFDHLLLTHKYYDPRIAQGFSSPAPVQRPDVYTPSFLGGIYMHFAFNPKYKFPARRDIYPDISSNLSPATLDRYLAKLEEIRELFGQAAAYDLAQTRVPIEKKIRFNMGDVLQIAVYHDNLHVGQARRVLALQQE